MSSPSGDANPTSEATAPGVSGGFADDEPTTAVTADIVLFAYRDGILHVLLVERGWPPFQGCRALPGGFKEPHEGPETAAHRELEEETGLTSASLRLVGAYGDPGRDPRGPVTTIAYATLLNTMPTPVAGDDARAAEWTSIYEVLGNPGSVAFDHHRIILDALALVYARQHRENERRGLLAEIAELTNALRETDAHIDLIERERDDAFADADHWREQAGEPAPSAKTENGEVPA
jgi:8-oxo-dGTP diphosphatase